LLYQDGKLWKPVETTSEFGTELNRYNSVKFSPLQTTALRIEVQLQPKYSGGILEWKCQ
jgi:uncharacterized protein